MRIVWDEPKRQANLDKHGFDFAELNDDFFSHAVVVQARGQRYLAVGTFGISVIAVVFRPLGTEAISVISMRPANKRETRYNETR